ncbi:MAG: hypothetical protein GPJ07_03960 [Microcystis aeruginosa G13-07]|jgi:hypothetical protein|nr:hypothetical protein [Microcystis aeruginosa SX13-11]NCR43284.1 hypothetical protein [Microcystis aeruginosa SX13-01]NCR66636.1 hypothetical protein [Microcystis aeruginosa LL11-07]NCR89184.1 hypothetical protein [Microcystis aeruginosa G13-10]NCS01409.1 hypothetical protein [Microcystis aeruginosa G13-11]NCS05804.1 hypothetical protein [Microcystis aeruginosa G13-07]NCS19132.1 hypothetical protein [Microcystis aeruginosa G11-06]NCS34591.1 hypothetical protein [Microcystis aeruginosa G11-
MNLKHLLPKILTTILATLVTFVFSPSGNKALLAADTQADHQSNLEGRLAKVREMIGRQRIIDEKPQTLDKSVKIGGQAIAKKTDDGGSGGGTIPTPPTPWHNWHNWNNWGNEPQANR